MPVFFQGAPGRAVALFDPAVPASLGLAAVYPALGWDLQRSLITRVTVAHRGNYQFLHTIGNQVYVYAFGDRVGSLTVSGLAAASGCSEADPAHGVEYVLSWYAMNRVSARRAPVRVAIGARTAFDAFVVGVNADASDPALRLVSFSLELAVPPGV